MKTIYTLRTGLILLFFIPGFSGMAQLPTTLGPGNCAGLVANFNTNDGGFNSPSIYGGVFDSSFYYNASRGYWTDYNPPLRITEPGFPRVQSIVSPPYINSNPIGTFNIGFYYIINNIQTDRFVVRIISITSTPQGTVANVEATTGVQSFSTWSTPLPYPVDIGPNPTPFMTGTEGNVCLRMIDPDITNGPNTTYRVEVIYIVNSPFFVVFDNLSIGPSTIPLPVDFIGLVAKRNTASNTIDLKWDVSQEVNVNEYQIERSENGSPFSNIGNVMAKGKSIYSFTNYNVSSNTMFYRIKSVDIDGRSKYSGIIKLSGSAADSYANTLSVYPVPAKDEIVVAHKKLLNESKMTISSVDGKILKTIIPAKGSSHTPVNVSNMSPGVYFLRLEDRIGNVQNIKFIKS